MPNRIGITKETFKGYNTDSKLDTLYDLAITTDETVQSLKKRKKYDTGIALMFAGVMGFFGGLVKGFVK